jgi:hypothetical protein
VTVLDEQGSCTAAASDDNVPKYSCEHSVVIDSFPEFNMFSESDSTVIGTLCKEHIAAHCI